MCVCVCDFSYLISVWVGLVLSKNKRDEPRISTENIYFRVINDNKTQYIAPLQLYFLIKIQWRSRVCQHTWCSFRFRYLYQDIPLVKCFVKIHTKGHQYEALICFFVVRRSMLLKNSSTADVGVTKPIFLVSIFSDFFKLWKHTLFIQYHVYIWQVSLQLSCGCTCHIQMWFQ